MINNLQGDSVKYLVIPRRQVKKKEFPLLKSSHKWNKFKRIVSVLKRNPKSRLFYGEKLYSDPPMYSMRIDSRNRVIYKIVPKLIPQSHLIGVVKIYEVWGHYKNWP